MNNAKRLAAELDAVKHEIEVIDISDRDAVLDLYNRLNAVRAANIARGSQAKYRDEARAFVASIDAVSVTVRAAWALHQA
jgi:hypothetical protein